MNTLENVKVGDTLFVGRSGYDQRLVTVSKVGKLHLTTSEGMKYNLRDGRRAATSRSIWNSSWATLATEEEIYEFKRANRKRHLVTLIGQADLKEKSVETLEAVLDLLK